MPRSYRTSLSLALFLSITSSVLGQQPTPQQGPIPPAVAQQQAIAYWTTETGWKSELQLRNNAVGQDLTVTPALRLASGAETSLAPVTIKSQEVKAIDLDAAIAAAGAPQLTGTYGSLVLRYQSPTGGSLYAAEMIRQTGYPVAFHIDATGSFDDPQAGSREGIWWLPNSTASDYLILTNQGQNVLPLDLSLYDASGKENRQRVVLAAFETSRFSLPKLVQAAGLAGSYGGIKVSAAAQASSLNTLHFLFDDTMGFSALLKMFSYDPQTKLQERDYAKTGVWTMRAPMLALTNPDPALAFPSSTTLHPELFVRNTTGKPEDVALRFNWRTASNTGAAAGPALHLNPYETRLVDVAALQSAGTLPKAANWTSVTLTTAGLPDEIVAVAASYDQTLKFGAQTPFSDQLTLQWEGGMWEYDPYHDSIITAGNGGTKPTRTAFTIFYNQGAQRYDLEQTLQPDEQMWIDVSKLIREHVPDKNGNVLPADLTMGSYEFRDLTNIDVGTLFEGKVIYDKTNGHASYGCASCCGYSQVTTWWNPLNISLGSGAQNGVNAYNGCTFFREDVSDSFFISWSSSNTAIATVDAYGNHNGIAIGSTTSQTRGQLQGIKIPQQCPIQTYTPSDAVNVTNPPLHSYPNPPLTGCRVTVPFNGVVNTVTNKKHQAQDTVGSNIQVGTPVYAPETGKITNFVTGKPHDPRSTSQCAGQNSPANFVEVTSTSDGAVTRLYHVTILPSLSQMTLPIPVTGGQQIGTIDISGCTSAPHTHIQRKLGGVLVDFKTPCDNSHFDNPLNYYDDSDGTWP